MRYTAEYNSFTNQKGKQSWPMVNAEKILDTLEVSFQPFIRNAFKLFSLQIHLQMLALHILISSTNVLNIGKLVFELTLKTDVKNCLTKSPGLVSPKVPVVIFCQLSVLLSSDCKVNIGHSFTYRLR